MYKKITLKIVFMLLAAALLFLANSSQDAALQNQIEHGRYLVEQVAMCVQCHTPRTALGEWDETRRLMGAPMLVKSPFANQQWASRAPTIAGLPGWEEEAVLHLLETGKRPDGRSPLPPMPPFRLSRKDAAAVVACLKSL